MRLYPSPSPPISVVLRHPLYRRFSFPPRDRGRSLSFVSPGRPPPRVLAQYVFYFTPSHKGRAASLEVRMSQSSPPRIDQFFLQPWPFLLYPTKIFPYSASYCIKVFPASSLFPLLLCRPVFFRPLRINPFGISYDSYVFPLPSSLKHNDSPCSLHFLF